jgi:hypothetical protein
VRRELCVLLVVLVALFGCTNGAPEPDPEPDPDPVEENAGPSGLRVGVVLPPGDTAAADEVDVDRLALGSLADDREEVAELRTVVPDSAAFVGDVAALLAEDGYGLVCVIGADAQQVVLDLADRRVGTEFCALPADPELEVADNVLLMDLEVEELGHVVGAALTALADEDPAEVLLGADRVGLERFRQGVRAGFGGAELRQVAGDLEDLEDELDEAIDTEVVALALDAGRDGGELAERAAGALPTVAPAPLLDDEDAALRWRVRWDRVLERVLAYQLGSEAERPTTFGFEQEAFELMAGGRSTSAMRAAVDTVAGELARGERQALGDDDDDDEEEDDEG